jgi:uncharacterized protein YjiS (DUF1127 family)
MLSLIRRQPAVTSLPWEKLARFGRRAADRAVAWYSRTRQLEALSRLDDRLLADIGLIREDQTAACSKLF